MLYRGKKIFVVMPAYNAEKTLERTYADLPKGMFEGVILVDDKSSDRTVEIAKRIGLTVVRHEENRGYGGNQKTCYKTALGMGADIVVMVHPDHQYDPKFIPAMLDTMIDGGYQAVFGSRMAIRENALKGGMPFWKFLANIALTAFGNHFLGTRLTEFHSGFRAYGKEVFESIDIGRNSDNFVFDTQIIIQMIERGMRIAEVPITTRYFKEASQIGFFSSLRYGYSIVYNIILYKMKLRRF